MRRWRWVAGALLVASGWALAIPWLDARLPPKLRPAPTPEELEHLRTQRDALRRRYLALRAPLLKSEGFDAAPGGDLLVGVPTRFVSSVVEQLVTGLMGEVALTLQNIEVHAQDEVQANLLLGRRTLGRFQLDVTIRKVEGRLRPGKPMLTFGGNRIGVRMTVRLAGGAGTASLRFRWKSQGLADVVCGDLDVQREVGGRVTPGDYPVEGSFELSVAGGALIATPRFGDLSFRIRPEAGPEAWSVVDRLIEEQGPLCRAALRKVDVKRKLSELLARGFEVRLPPALFRPVRIPVAIDQDLRLQEQGMSLHVRASGLAVGPRRVWFAARLSAERLARPTASAGSR